MTRQVGLDGLSMRRLGDELGVWPMAVYHHVPNKKALISLVADAAMAELEIPEFAMLAAPRSPDDWISAGRAFSHAARRHYLRYPGLAGFLLAHGPPPGALRIVEYELAGLRKLGATHTEAARIYSTSALWLISQIHAEDIRTSTTGEDDRVTRLVGLTSVSPEAFPTLAESAPYFPEVAAPAAQFEYGLELLLE